VEEVGVEIGSFTSSSLIYNITVGQGVNGANGGSSFISSVSNTGEGGIFTVYGSHGGSGGAAGIGGFAGGQGGYGGSGGSGGVGGGGNGQSGYSITFHDGITTNNYFGGGGGGGGGYRLPGGETRQFGGGNGGSNGGNGGNGAYGKKGSFGGGGGGGGSYGGSNGGNAFPNNFGGNGGNGGIGGGGGGSGYTEGEIIYSAGGNGIVLIYFQNPPNPNTSNILNVYGNATITNNCTATNFIVLSDYRIKENPLPLDETFTVDNLNPVIYRNIRTNKIDIGLIAHELQKSYPYLVNGEKDGENMQSVNYNGLIGIIINEIKNLKKELKSLQDS